MSLNLRVRMLREILVRIRLSPSNVIADLIHIFPLMTLEECDPNDLAEFFIITTVLNLRLSSGNLTADLIRVLFMIHEECDHNALADIIISTIKVL